MAAGRTRNLLLAIWACVCVSVCAADTLSIAHSPSYVTFGKDAGPIRSAEVPDVLSLALGFSSSNELKWNGLGVGDLFRRPKAGVLITVETTDSSLSLDAGSGAAAYPLSDGGEVSLQALRDTVLSAYGEKALLLDVSPDVKGLQASTEYQKLFQGLPGSVGRLTAQLRGDDSVLAGMEAGSLNLTHPADAALLGELQLLKDITDKLRANPLGVADSAADVFSFRLAGLRIVQSEYGAASAQAKDAASLLRSFIPKFTAALVKLYGGDALVGVVTSHQEPLMSRHSRSLLQAPDAATTPSPSGPPQIGNKAEPYDENYPAMFNIILWVSVILVVAVYAIVYGMYNLDPGDTIIYRVTSQRMKID